MSKFTKENPDTQDSFSEYQNPPGTERTADTRRRVVASPSPEYSDEEDSSQEEFKLSIHIPGWSYSSKQAMKAAFRPDEYCSDGCFKRVYILSVQYFCGI